ncbi:hypothetical protein [Roseibium algae]|uniref:Uncharacterized protein n=1 Tax=Roseibium algae TaxID=3123038 RepID=A0ABU8THD8_9HYPH
MSKDLFSSQTAKLVQLSNAVLANASPVREDKSAWEDAAEDCVLTRIDSIRILGGLPTHQPALERPDRLSRLEALLAYWANGCPFVVDERLFADILKRRRLLR